MNIEQAVKLFEQKFPNHDFGWRYSPTKKRAVAHCPFHNPDKHPSFNLFIGNDSKIHYNCFSCQTSGTIDYLLKRENLSEEEKKRIEEFSEKQKLLKKIRDDSNNNLISASQKKDISAKYLCERFGISCDKLKDFLKHYSDIGLINKKVNLPEKIFTDEKQINRLKSGNYIAFFHRNINGQISMIHLRKINSHNFETLKIFDAPTFFSRNSNLLSGAKVMFLVEGEFDATVLDASSFTETGNIISDFTFASVSGTSGFNEKTIRDAKKWGAKVILMPDTDEGGKKALLNLYKKENKSIEKISVAEIPQDLFDGIKDADELFKKRTLQEIREYIGYLRIRTLEEYITDYELKEYLKEIKEIDQYPSNIKQSLMDEKDNKFKGSFIEQIENVDDVWDKYINKNNDAVNLNGIYLQKGDINLIAADNGTGKTFITLQMCVDYVMKEHRKVLFWAGEDSKTTIIKRLNLILKKNKSKEIAKNLIDIVTYIDTPLFSVKYGNIEETKEFKMLKHIIKEDKYGLIVLDPLSVFLMMISESDNTAVRWGMTRFNKLVSETDKILVFTHHINKDSMRNNGILKEISEKLKNNELIMDAKEIASSLKVAIRGGMAITDLPRLVYFVLPTKPDVDGYARRLLFRVKSNAGLPTEYTPITLPFKGNNIGNTSVDNDNIRRGEKWQINTKD